MLDILFEDAHVLAVNKPAGIATQGRHPGESTLEAAVRCHLAPEDPTGVYLGTVHRLDRPVSGVIVWAKNARAARRLAEQFAGRQVTKEYAAIVSGDVTPERGLWQDWLYEEDTGLGRVQVCHPASPRARRAETRYQVRRTRQSPGGTCLLSLFPLTGRTHQLRVQSGSRGHPILGDATYGSVLGFPSGIALHARSLTFAHPITNATLILTAEFPRAWSEAGIEVEDAG